MVALALVRRAFKDCANDPLLVRMAPEGAFHTEAGEDTPARASRRSAILSIG